MPTQEKIEHQALNLGDREYLLRSLQDSLTRVDVCNFILDLGETQSLILLKSLEVWAGTQAMTVIRASLEQKRTSPDSLEGIDQLPFRPEINAALRKSRIKTLAELIEVVAQRGSKSKLQRNGKINDQVLVHIANYLYYHHQVELDDSLLALVVPIEDLTIAQAHFKHRFENALRRNFETLGDVLLGLKQPGAKDAFLSIRQFNHVSLQALINKLILVYGVDASELDSSLDEYVKWAVGR